MKTKVDSELLNIHEAAHRLGLKASTLRAWVLARRIAYCKIGRAVRIPAFEIEKIVERGYMPAREVRQ